MAAPSLSTILTAIELDITARLNPTVVTYGRGRKDLARRRLPPSVVWVPTRDVISSRSASIPQAGTVNPITVGRPIYTRKCGVDAHVWGASLNLAEELLHHVLGAIRRYAYGINAPDDVSWEQPLDLDYGEQCTLSFQLFVPVLDLTPDIVVVTAFEEDLTGAVQGDGILESGDI